MPFNQQMTLPVQLGIVADDDKDPPRLRALPVPELATLRDGEPALNIGDGTQLKLKEARTLVGDLDGFEAWVAVDLGKADGFTLDLRGTKLKYDAKKGVFTCKDVTAPAKVYDGQVSVTVFVDRGSIEVFAEGGKSVMSVAAIPDEKNRKLEFVPEGGEVTIRHAVVHRMKSAWEK
jgi:fructan beta-fructosidase